MARGALTEATGRSPKGGWSTLPSSSQKIQVAVMPRGAGNKKEGLHRERPNASGGSGRGTHSNVQVTGR